MTIILVNLHQLTYPVKNLMIVFRFGFAECLQCFDAVGWAAGRASGL